MNLPEFYADQVFRIGARRARDRWAALFENQLYPDPRLIPRWMLKKYALQERLGMPVMLVAVYLRRGRYRTFPSADLLQKGGLTNASHFSTIRMWDHRRRIESGELAELAPLLALCYDHPGQGVLERERDLIRGLEPAVQGEMLAMAAAVGLRVVTQQVVWSVFRQEMEIMKSAGFIEEWLTESREQGRTEEARRIALELLADRFGPLPEELTARIQDADGVWCERVIKSAWRASRLEDVDLTS